MAIAVGVATFALAACADPTSTTVAVTTGPVASWVPNAQGPAPTAVLDLPRAVAVMADYDRRNNAAIKATLTSFNPKQWRTADTGVLLAVDDFDTRNQQLLPAAERAPLTGSIMTPTAVYASNSTQIPRLALVVGTVTRSGTKDAHGVVRLMAQPAAGGPWLSAQALSIDPGLLPAPLIPGAQAAVSEHTLDRFAALRPEIVRFLEKGTASTQLDTATLARTRDSLGEVVDVGAFSREVTCVPPPEGTVGAAGVWNADGAALGILALRCQVHATVKTKDAYIDFPPRVRDLLGITAKYPQDATFTMVVQLVLTVPSTGKARVLGSTVDQMLTR